MGNPGPAGKAQVEKDASEDMRRFLERNNLIAAEITKTFWGSLGGYFETTATVEGK